MISEDAEVLREISISSTQFINKTLANTCLLYATQQDARYEAQTGANLIDKRLIFA